MSDYSDTSKVEKKLKEASDRMDSLAPHVGHAKQILRFNNERCKGLLAKYAAPFLLDGESSSAANTKARANPVYQEELQVLIDQLEDSNKTISEWEAVKVKYESARSLLSLEKEKMRL